MMAATGVARASSPDAALSVRGLECMRGDRVVLTALDLTVRHGEILQIVGPNGSGKTTLIRVLSSLSTPTAGAVHWRGQNIHSEPIRWREEMLFAGHTTGTSPNLTVAENQRFTLALADQRPQVAMHEALARVGLADYAGTLVGRLSAGQRQRLVLARLIQLPARAWLLDEPLTALDESGKQLFESLLIEHAAAGGLAILATHQHLTLPASLDRQLRLESAA